MMPMASDLGGIRPALVRGVADLIDYAYELRHSSATQSVLAAERAVAAVECLKDSCTFNRDLRCRAWLVFGNSLRISGALADANNALEVSERFRLLGSGDHALELTSLQFRASLAISCHRFEDALAHLAAAEEIAILIGDGYETAKARIKRAIIATYRGETETAAATIYDALLRGPLTPELRQSALEVLMFAYALGEEPIRALQVSLQCAPLFAGCGKLLRMKLDWVRGLVVAQLSGRTSPLRELQAQYLAAHLNYEAALVGLDIAISLARLGRMKEARRYLAEAAPVVSLHRLSLENAESLAGLKVLRMALSARA